MNKFLIVLIFLLHSIDCQVVQNNYPSVLNSVGVGYNILYGNPDGKDWRHGGEDPGLLVTRRILKLESESTSLPDQLVYVRHDSCQSSATDYLVYSPKTYQQHLADRVSFAGTSLPDLEGSAFTLSAGYLTVKKETESLHYVLQDTSSTCVNGTARYTLNLASVNYYHLTDEFILDVCSLPEVFDTDTYTRFLDRWGTHVVTGMKVGSRQTTMTIGTRRDYIETVRQKSDIDVSLGGPMYNSDASWMVDLDTFKLRPSFPITVGNSVFKLSTGSKESPEPISLNLTSIDVTLTPDFWNFGQFSEGLCQNNISTTLAIRRQHLITALRVYASQKGATMPKDEKLAMPVVWPTGSAGLPKPNAGCPSPSNSWLEGWLTQNPETQTPDSRWNATHLDGTLTKTSFLLKFCIKPKPEEFSRDWPPGDYCIFKYDNCPHGFVEGFVQWDDENTNNTNAHGGVLPDGVYGKDTRINYCCRSDGHSYTPIVLPTEKPFYLFRYKHGCQAVHGMTSLEEYIMWDDDDSYHTTSAAIGTVHPGMDFCNPPKYPGCGTASTIYYCYYEKYRQAPSIIG